MASRKDVEAGRAHVLIYIKNQVRAGLQTIGAQLKQAAGSVRQVAEPLNQLSSIATQAGGAILGPLIAAVTQLDEAKQPLAEIKKALVEGLGRPLLPILMQIRDVVLRFSEWAKRNPEIIRQVARIGAILIGIGIAAKIIASGFILVAGSLTLASAAATALAFLLSPTGLIVVGAVALAAALVAGVVAWARWTESGRRATKEMAAGFAAVKDRLTDIFKILVVGEWGLAGEIAGQTFWLGFLKSLADLESLLPDIVQEAIGFPSLRAALKAEGDLVSMRIKALDSIKRFDSDFALPGVPALAGALRGQHPQQTAMTTHEALGLTFGTPQGKNAAARDEEKTLLRQIKLLIAAGATEDAKILQDILRELRKNKGATFAE